MKDFDQQLFWATIPELNAKLKAREVSAVELAQAFGERIERLGPRYNALALPMTEIAIRRAKNVDSEFKRERLRGPLQGVPFAAKDLLSVAGQITTWGARPYAAQVFDYTATVLAKLDKLGSLLMAKLAMVELAGGGGYNTAAASLFGPGLNPWDRTRWAGGSSSGSAAAVAAGLVPFALGSETSGSILTPAAFCGVTGLRPTYGLVSRHGAMALSWTMDKIGPLARTVEDCALVLQSIAGKDPLDPSSSGKSFYYVPQYARKLSDLKVGFAPIDFSDRADAPLRPALAQALETVKRLGVQVVEAKLPDFPYGAMTGAIIGAEGASIFEPLITSGQVDQLADPDQIAGLKARLEMPAKDYLKAMRIRSLMQHEFRKLFADVDILLAPARYSVAPLVSQPLDYKPPDAPKEPDDPGMSSLIPAGNLGGMPALSLPCGLAAGLPVAIQLVGNPFSENTLLAVGKAFQDRTDFHRQHPKVD
jgi:aspartyl-tRNA(Asn)/glutamyl-tRNA(Gln) amidotransferase subunit A